MQLCALDSDGQVVFARSALKQKDYICMECGQPVRLRAGLHRRFHYYHTQPIRACSQHSKGIVHLMLQDFLKCALPPEEVQLEHHFKEISRIADVVWLSKKLVFEIQCSSITGEEVTSRNADYASIGYQVVWIFHDSKYNQRRFSSAEYALRHHPHYFTNIDRLGKGLIYDQFCLFERGVRTHQLPRMPVDLSEPQLFGEHREIMKKKLPDPLHERAQKWPLGFKGDSIDCCLTLENLESKNAFDIQWQQAISRLYAKRSERLIWKMIKRFYQRLIILPYLALLRLLLERACR